MKNPALIFHETQSGSLCAQHALNNLLQGEYFTAIDLADIAKSLDEAETNARDANNIDEDVKRAAKDKSFNMDDSGFFSIQVIAKALQSFSLDLMPYRSPQALKWNQHPESATAYILNMQEHWFTIRKFGAYWYNLNSTAESPQYISDTYLGMLIHQFEQEKYTVNIIIGELPQTELDQLAINLDIRPLVKEWLASEYQKLPDALHQEKDESWEKDNSQDWMDNDIQAAILKSMESTKKNDT